jgi:crotonobetainyl-CoA:carnitine CoA-transferase CaiB-like acyl-CoA transferase
MTQALEGIRVLDVTIWQQGPMTTAMLSDWGADVIKIEGPDWPDPGRSMVRYEVRPGGFNAYFETHNRNKRGIVLDLQTDRGREVFHRLVEDADVVVQNFRPGVSKRLGIDYETLCRINPKLIYCQASGFGLKGPDAGNPAVDPLAQARGGLMSVTGEPETPPTRVFNGFADQISAFLLAYGIVLALFHRQRTGEGQSLDGSLLQGSIAVQAFNITSYLTTGTYAGQPMPRISRRLTSPLWNHYKAKDGKWVMLAMAQPGRYWPAFREVIQEATGVSLEPEALDVDWMRMHAAELMGLIAKLDELFATKPVREWVELLRQHDMIVEAVQEYSELADDPQVVENEMIVTLNHASHGAMQMVGPAVNLHSTPGSIRRPAPEFGQHTEEVLLEAGFSWEELEDLRAEGVIGPRAAEAKKA